MLSTIDLFKDLRFTLLAGRTGQAWVSAFRRVAADAGLEFQAYTVGPNGDLLDHQAAFHELYELQPEGAVLVRPDGHVAWRCAGACPAPVDVLSEVMRTVLAAAPQPALEAA
jgi:2,4-dichlorophenol 6-monooxygenase